MRFRARADGGGAEPGAPAASVERCLGELPHRVGAIVDRGEFARLDHAQRGAVAELGEQLEAHVVAYTLGAKIRGIALCAVASQAALDRDQLAALRRAERRLPAGVALVAYARPMEMRRSAQDRV